MKNYKNYILENKKDTTLAVKLEKEFLLMQLGDDIDTEIRSLVDMGMNIEYTFKDISDGISIRFEMKYFESLFGFSADYVEDYEVIRDEHHYNFDLEEMKWSDLDEIESYDKIMKLFNLSVGDLFRFLNDIVPELKSQFEKYRDIIIRTYSDNIFNNFKRIEEELPYEIKMSSDYSDIILDFYYDKMNKFQATSIKELLIETKSISSQIKLVTRPFLNTKDENIFFKEIEPIFDEIYEYMKENKTEILNSLNIEDFFKLHMIGGEFLSHLNTYDYQEQFIANSAKNYKLLLKKQGVGLGDSAFRIDDKIKEKYKYLLNLAKYKI